MKLAFGAIAALAATQAYAYPSSSTLKVSHTGLLCSRGDCEAGSTIGAEIKGVSNFTTLTEDDIAFIRNVMNEYKVIYFSGAGKLMDPETQLAFARRFGSVYPTVSKVPEYVEKGVHQSKHSVRHDTHDRQGDETEGFENSINTMVEANKAENKFWKGARMPKEVARLVREPGDPFAFGEGYHADVTFYDEPPFFTFLVARELPGDRDDTFFIDVSKAYETLEQPIKDEITGTMAYHNDSAGKVAVHPFVRTHPETGVQSIYVNSHFTHGILGYEESEAKSLLDKVFDHVESQPIFKFKWTCDVEALGTKNPDCMHALMWDNRQLQHTATTDWAFDKNFNERRRELHRVTISGDERPFYRSSHSSCTEQA